MHELIYNVWSQNKIFINSALATTTLHVSSKMLDLIETVSPLISSLSEFATLVVGVLTIIKIIHSFIKKEK